MLGAVQTRRAAEAALEAARAQPDALLHLMHEVATGDDLGVRHMAAIVLGKWAAKLWPQVAPEQAAALRQALQERCTLGVLLLLAHTVPPSV